MHYAQQMFICATLCLAASNHGSQAENVISIKNDSSHLITTVGNILTPLLLKQVERRLLNHTTISDGVISIEKLDSSTPVNTDAIPTSFDPKPSNETSNSPTRKLTTIPTTVLRPAGRANLDSSSKVDEDKLDSARAQQRQLENQFPFDLRNQFNLGFPGVGRQSNEGIFGNGDTFTTNQFRLLTSLDQPRASDDILGIQGISGSQIPERNPALNDPSRPVNSQLLPLDYRRLQDFDRFRFDGRYSDQSQFFDPSLRAEAGVRSNTGSRAGVEADVAGLAERYNGFAGQLFPQNNLPLQYRQSLRNGFPSSPLNSQAIDGGGNSRPVPAGINNPRAPVDLPFRPYPSQYTNENVDPFSQRFQNSFPDARNTQQGFNYPPQLYFPSHPGDAVSPGSRTSVDSQTLNNNNGNNSGLISSRRSEDSLTKPTNTVEKVTSRIPGVESLQDRHELEKFLFPQQDDYSDIRVSPDFFKQHILESKILDKYTKTNIV